MPPVSSDHILDTVLSATGITPHALARKLRVPVSKLELWKEGLAAPPPEVESALKEIIGRIEASIALEGPRQQRPHLESDVIHDDSISRLRSFPDESVDLILSDIPYGIGLDDWDVLHANSNSALLGTCEAQRRAGAVFNKRRKPINGWSSADKKIPLEYYKWCNTWSSQWYRLLKPGGSAFVFAGRRFAHRCVASLEDSGFNLRDCLSWKRRRAVFRAQRLSLVYKKRGDIGESEKWEGWRIGNLRPIYEPIYWFFKPYQTTIADNVLDHNLGAMNLERFKSILGTDSNSLECDFEQGERGYHEAQKPLALMRGLIELTTLPGQLVLDPFAGSGSTAVAAKSIGRRYLAIDSNRTHVETIKLRLDQPQQLQLI